jgi:hypothetical protein
LPKRASVLRAQAGCAGQRPGAASHPGNPGDHQESGLMPVVAAQVNNYKGPSVNKSFLTTLGWWRWFAALSVVLYHVRFFLFAAYDHVHDKGLLLKLFYFVTSLGHEGFVIYMVVSGMMLGGLSLQRWSLQGREAWRDVVHKLIWFYAFLIPSVLFGGVLDVLGTYDFWRTGIYAYFDQFTPDLSLVAVAENLLPMQRFVVPGLGSNSMLYLLAYECWAYFAFATFILLGRRRAGAAAGALVGVAGSLLAPEFFGYLILWVLGAVAFHNRMRLPLRLSRGVATIIFAASLLGSRILGAPLASMSPQIADVLRTVLDLQFGLALTIFLVAWARKAGDGGRWSSALARLNRRFPAANSVLLACHFPFMMFIVGAASRFLPLPIAGQPDVLAFVIFAVVICAIYAYSLAMARLAARLARLMPHGRRLPAPVPAI